jgi:hypothetical protein
MKTEGMDEGDMEEGKDREGKGWEILEFKRLFLEIFGIVILGLAIFMCIH